MRRYLSPLVIAYVLIVAAAAYGFYAQHYEEAKRHAQVCDTQRDFRAVMRDLVVRSTAQQGGFDLTSLPSFKRLDPATQDYMRELSKLAAGGSDSSGETFRDFALRRLKDLPCAA